MPRIAKREYDTSFFHIMVQGIRKEYIFEDIKDKEKYINMLYKKLEKNNIKIIAYCIMSNHAHMLIYVENIKELSEYMRAVNTAYALYYNKKYRKAGYVFILILFIKAETAKHTIDLIFTVKILSAAFFCFGQFFF